MSSSESCIQINAPERIRHRWAPIGGLPSPWLGWWRFKVSLRCWNKTTVVDSDLDSLVVGHPECGVLCPKDSVQLSTLYTLQ